MYVKHFWDPNCYCCFCKLTFVGSVGSRVARWHIFKPKIPIWVFRYQRDLQWLTLIYFIAVWSILRPFGICCGHLVYSLVIWYTFPVLVYCTNKNLATVVGSPSFWMNKHSSEKKVLPKTILEQ
jgi:hypothetical protein